MPLSHSKSPHLQRLSLRSRVWIALAAIGLAEMLIMGLLQLLLPEIPAWQQALLDGASLALLILPILWLLVLRPAALDAEDARLKAQAIMDTAGEGIITTDERGVMLGFNRAAESIFGYDAEEVLGRELGMLMPESRRMAHAGYMRAYLDGQGSGRVIGQKRLMEGQRKNGEVFPLEIAVSDTRSGQQRVFTSVVHDVSAYKATEAALAKTNALLERILCDMHSPIAYLDRNFNFLRVNKAYAEADSKSTEFFVGKNHFALYPNPENEAIFRHVVETGESFRVYAKAFEYPGQPERGVFYWDWSLEPEKDEHGQVTNLLLMLHDVTARELAEQERMRAIGRFRTLFEASGDAIFIHDLEGRLLEVNQAACAALGYMRDELLKLTLRQVATPDCATRFEEHMAEIKTRDAVVFEAVQVRRDSTIIPVEISSRLIEFSGQHAVLSTARDLTVRKRMDAALRESEQNTRALLDSIHESALMLAPNGTILAINRTGADRFHETPDSMRGKNLFGYLPAQLAESRRRHLETVLSSGMPVDFEDTREGHLFDISFHPVLDSQGAIHRIAVYAQDITTPRRLKAIEELLRAVDEQILQGVPMEHVATLICDRVSHLLGLQLAWLGEKKPDGSVQLITGAGPATAYQDELRRIGVRWDDSPTGRGTTGMAIRLARTQIVDVARTKAFSPWREAAQAHGLASVCSIPIVIRGEIYGAFTFYSSQADAFQDAELVHTLDDITARASVALEASYDHEKLRLLGAALATASNAVFITNRQGEIEWVNDAFIRLSGYSEQEIIGNTPNLLRSGLHDQAYYERLWNTILAGETFTSETTERRRDGSLYTVRQIITPVRGSHGEVDHFISMQEDISEQLAAQKKIEFMAHFDALTSLPNRTLFFDRLKQAAALSRRSAGHVGLLFLDLDRFKPVNDTYGHAVGDALLKAVAERLQHCVRESDTVSRIAGDEFTVVLPQIASRTDAATVAEKIVKSISEPFLIDGHDIRIGTSVGIALYPDDTKDEQQLVKLADNAMYVAKNQGRNTFRFHTTA